MIGRPHHVVIDCPDPEALAGFYSELLGLRVTYRSDDFVVVARDDTTSRSRSSWHPSTGRPGGRTPSTPSRCIST